MSARILLSGTLVTAAVRRKRKSDGTPFAITKIRDTDRGEARIWTAFANDMCLIELLEEVRVGEPIACSGPFSVAIDDGHLAYRMTIEAVVDTRRRRKPKGQISKESRIESDELDLAPQAPELNDSIPF